MWGPAAGRGGRNRPHASVGGGGGRAVSLRPGRVGCVQGLAGAVLGVCPPLWGVECSAGHAQDSAFAPGSSEMSVDFFVIFVSSIFVPTVQSVFSPRWFLCILLLGQGRALQQGSQVPRPIYVPACLSIIGPAARSKRHCAGLCGSCGLSAVVPTVSMRLLPQLCIPFGAGDRCHSKTRRATCRSPPGGTKWLLSPFSPEHPISCLTRGWSARAWQRSSSRPLLTVYMGLKLFPKSLQNGSELRKPLFGGVGEVEE